MHACVVELIDSGTRNWLQINFVSFHTISYHFISSRVCINTVVAYRYFYKRKFGRKDFIWPKNIVARQVLYTCARSGQVLRKMKSYLLDFGVIVTLCFVSLLRMTAKGNVITNLQLILLLNFYSFSLSL